MKNVAVAPGSILWLRDNEGTRAVIARADHGALGHPVLVLSNPDVLAGNSQRGRVNVQILIITSLGNTSLSRKFPGQKRKAVAKRREYLPLKRSPPEPHPDSGVLLEVRITGKVAPTRTRQSYVHLCVPLLVARENLVGLPRGTVKLELRAFAIVLDHLRSVCPDVVVPLEAKPLPVASPAPGGGRGKADDEEEWIEESPESESEVGVGVGKLQQIQGRTNSTSHKVSSATVVRTPVSRTPVSRASISRTPVSRTSISRTPVSRTAISRTAISRTAISRTPVARTPTVRTPTVRTPTVHTPAVHTPAVRTPPDYGATTPRPAPAHHRPLVHLPPAHTPVSPPASTPVSPPAYGHTDPWTAAPDLEAAGHNDDGSKSPLWRRAYRFCACVFVVVVVAFVGTVAF